VKKGEPVQRKMIVCGFALLVATVAAAGERAVSPVVLKSITSAVSNPARPTTDIARDADRQPAQTLAFTGVKPGDKGADYAAGSGYFTSRDVAFVQSRVRVRVRAHDFQHDRMSRF
jgi:predicted methyltransferase